MSLEKDTASPQKPATPVTRRPRLAIVSGNTLTALGMERLLHDVMPHMEILSYHDAEEMRRDGEEGFAHYFLTPEALFQDAAFFMRRLSRTTILAEGGGGTLLPKDCRRLDITLPAAQLAKAFLALGKEAHREGSRREQTPQPEEGKADLVGGNLSEREKEVLREVAKGRLNKEIADTLHISPTTVITHRRNITEKLGIKSVPELTIYAALHGLISL